MQFIDIRRIKVVLVLSAIVIAVASLYISHQLVRDLSMEERLRMEVWAEAMRAFNTADEKTDRWFTSCAARCIAGYLSRDWISAESI